ncbi:MAG: hypothetical protein IKW46_10530 [Bacteroidaceae bacterium]|jgi:hypothetical protein|nr:hypothetical protein [Bacteroidaceae bacterium]
MKNKITIKRSELQQQINLRNFYMGESAKRKDKDADTIQSSKEDEDLLLAFTHTACNELVTAVALRFPSISYTIDEKEIIFEFETPVDERNHLLPMLERAILDYLVNETIMHWLLLRRRDMSESNISLRASLYSNVLFMFAKMYNSKKIRRRATNLAGI